MYSFDLQWQWSNDKIRMVKKELWHRLYLHCFVVVFLNLHGLDLLWWRHCYTTESDINIRDFVQTISQRGNSRELMLLLTEEKQCVSINLSKSFYRINLWISGLRTVEIHWIHDWSFSDQWAVKASQHLWPKSWVREYKMLPSYHTSSNINRFF